MELYRDFFSQEGTQMTEIFFNVDYLQALGKCESKLLWDFIITEVRMSMMKAKKTIDSKW